MGRSEYKNGESGKGKEGKGGKNVENTDVSKEKRKYEKG